MAFDFPAGAAIDQIYTGPNGYIYTWDGEKWLKGSGTGSAAGGYVLKAGDVMMGFLTANADPIDPLHYATKAYVDAIFGALGAPGEAHVINNANQPEWGAPIDSGNF